MAAPLMTMDRLEHDSPIRGLTVSADGSTLVSADIDRLVKVWRRKDNQWQLVQRLNVRQSGGKVQVQDHIRDMSISPRGDRLFIASGNALTCYDVRSGRRIWKSEQPPELGFILTRPQAVAVSASGTVVCAFSNGTMETYSEDDESAWRWSDRESPAYLGFSRDDSTLIGSDFFTIGIWNLQKARQVRQWRLQDRIYALAVSPNQPVVAVRTLRQVRLFNYKVGQFVAQADANPGKPALAFAPEGRWLASVDAHGIQRFDADLRPLDRIDAPTGIIPLCTAITPDGELLWAGSDGRIRGAQ